MQTGLEYLARKYNVQWISPLNKMKGNHAVQSPSFPIPSQQKEGYQKGQERPSLANRQMGIRLT